MRSHLEGLSGPAHGPVRPARVTRCLAAVAVALGLAACGGGGADDTDPTPIDQTLADWRFDTDSGWTLAAESPSATRASVDAGQLLLESNAFDDGECHLASAQVGLSDPKLLAGSGLSHLVVNLAVSEWSLGLGYYDSAAAVPLLTLVFGGQRHSLRVQGFSHMPGQAMLSWTAGSGWTAQFDGVDKSLVASSVADAATPSLSLTIDGCSEGMFQRLRIDSLRLSGR